MADLSGKAPRAPHSTHLFLSLLHATCAGYACFGRVPLREEAHVPVATSRCRIDRSLLVVRILSGFNAPPPRPRPRRAAHHQEQTAAFLRFAAYKREQQLKEIDAAFEETVDTRCVAALLVPFSIDPASRPWAACSGPSFDAGHAPQAAGRRLHRG